MGRRGLLQTRHAEHRGPSLTAYCSQHAADFLEETMEYTVSMKVDGRVDVTMENYNG